MDADKSANGIPDQTSEAFTKANDMGGDESLLGNVEVQPWLYKVVHIHINAVSKKSC